jgi:menaquinone-dependent protoporphyrinogen oxidase
MVWRRLGFGEKAIMVAVRAQEGDFRDWDAIAAWADEIGQFFQSDLSAAEQHRGM